MFKILLPTLLLIIFSGQVNAQKWTDAEFRKANTAANASYLSNEEKNIVMYMNLIRLDGEKFYYTFLEDYINNYNAKVRKYRNYNELRITRNNSYYTSLLKHLRGIKNLQMFYPDDKLTSLSRSHAQDLNRNNLDTHESSNGDKFSKRLSRYFPNKAMSENIDFGYSNSLDIVCHLLLDCGVPSLGHRFNLLDQKYKLNTVGVSIQPHPSYTWCAVIDFVAQPTYYTNNE
ncbi:CAP domain-containing protein [Pedobacter riviphilus]|uniref:CAP domain-containing protein n=1 Tax=Pedobacter riviphilus TaxID=2766984 RepID=A0ABX6TLS4_9SPHI|nr:CAP domain-containing protein [Pedobacter riviphilus]QNR85539.1 CAP domain-containing protein [Pedobacter riviphilus]